MPAGTVAQAEGLLKISTGDYHKLYETTAMVWNKVKKGSWNELGDRGWEFPTSIGGNWVHGWMVDGGPYPAGGSIQTVRPTVYKKELVTALRLTARSIRDIKPGKAAVASWLDKNVSEAIDSGWKLLNRYAWGTGNGVLGTISVGASSATQTFNNNNNVRYFGFGMRVSVYNSTLTVLRGSGIITSKPFPGNTTLTLDTSVSTTTGDVVTVYGGANQAITGLKTIVDDTTEGPVMFEDLSRNEYTNWRAQVIDGTAGLDPEMLNRMIGAKISVALGSADRGKYELWSYTSQTQNYASLGYPLLRFAGPSKNLDLGYTSYGFQGMEWVEEMDLDKDRIMFMDWSTIMRFGSSDFGWEDTDGRYLRMVPSTTSGSAYDSIYEGYRIFEGNLGAADPRPNGKIISLPVPAGY